MIQKLLLAIKYHCAAVDTSTETTPNFDNLIGQTFPCNWIAGADAHLKENFPTLLKVESMRQSDHQH